MKWISSKKIKCYYLQVDVYDTLYNSVAGKAKRKLNVFGG
jgi:hypothetical protein